MVHSVMAKHKLQRHRARKKHQSSIVTPAGEIVYAAWSIIYLFIKDNTPQIPESKLWFFNPLDSSATI